MNMKPALVACLAIAPLLSGCFGASAECGGSGGPTDFRGQTLTILDHGAFSWMFAAINASFEAQTGAHLRLQEGGDAGTALKMAIDAKGNPPWDVIYGIDNALFGRGADAGIFEPYRSPRLSMIDDSVVRIADFERDGELLATPADYGYINVNYDATLNATHAQDDLPTTLSDLAAPAWARDFVVEDPRFSSPGLGFLIATVATFGENDAYDYLDYWTDLFDGGVLVTPDWSSAYLVHFTAGYGQYEEGFVGDRHVVVSYTTSPAAEVLFSYGTLTEPPSVSVEPASGVFHQVETIAILCGTDQLPLAKAFVDFVLGQEFQNQTAANMATYPVMEGIELPAEFQTLATEPGDLEPAPFTSAQLKDGVPRWIAEWRSLYQAERA